MGSKQAVQKFISKIKFSHETKIAIGTALGLIIAGVVVDKVRGGNDVLILKTPTDLRND